MRLGGIAILVGALALGGVAASAPSRAGRVVRIERVPPATAIPRMCMVKDVDQLICIGRPAIDEVVHLFETKSGKVVGSMKVDSVRDFTNFRCPGKAPVLFEVSGTLATGAPDLLDGTHGIVALRRAAIDSTSRLVKNLKPPSVGDQKTETNHQVEMAVDFDGDGAPDFVIEHYPCPDPSASARAPASCFDTYMERRGKLELVQHDAIQVCT